MSISNQITLQQGVTMTTKFRSQRPGLTAPQFAGKDILAFSETFDRAIFDAILAQPGCVGIRLYNGMSDDDKVHSIIVGVNSNNEDMVPSSAATLADGDMVLGEDSVYCPPLCPPPSPLNT